MKTVIETPTFQKQVESIWTEEERLVFISWISQNSLAGGARVIYFNLTEQDVIVLITLYQKSNQANIQAGDIK